MSLDIGSIGKIAKVAAPILEKLGLDKSPIGLLSKLLSGGESKESENGLGDAITEGLASVIKEEVGGLLS